MLEWESVSVWFLVLRAVNLYCFVRGFLFLCKIISCRFICTWQPFKCFLYGLCMCARSCIDGSWSPCLFRILFSPHGRCHQGGFYLDYLVCTQQQCKCVQICWLIDRNLIDNHCPFSLFSVVVNWVPLCVAWTRKGIWRLWSRPDLLLRGLGAKISFWVFNSLQFLLFLYSVYGVFFLHAV